MTEKLTAVEVIDNLQEHNRKDGWSGTNATEIVAQLESYGFHIIAPEDPETIERAAKALSREVLQGSLNNAYLEDRWRNEVRVVLKAAGGINESDK